MTGSVKKIVKNESRKQDSLARGVDSAISREITRLRAESLEITQLLSKAELSVDDCKRLKELLLRDAIHEAEDLSANEWREILESRVVIFPPGKEVSALVNMLCTA